MKTCTIGTLVYFDSFAGMVRGKVIWINDVNVHIKVTSLKNKTYKHGEVIHTNKLHTFPAACYHKTGIFTYRVDPFKWKEG